MKKVFLLMLVGMGLCFSSCEQEDLTRQYRMEFSGYYNITSIYTEGKHAFDLNNDGIASENLWTEYSMSGSALSSRTSLFFTRAEQGNYDGALSFCCPLQHLDSGLAIPPFSIETQVEYTGNIVEFAVQFKMVLSNEGEATWYPALVGDEYADAQIHIKLLQDGEVLSTENGTIELVIHQVPIYDCINKELTLQTLTYHLEHE